MRSFEHYLKEIGEVGHVESIVQSIVYVSGLPGVKLNEVVLTQTGQKGLVESIGKELIEVLMLSSERILPGVQVTRTNETLKIPISLDILGRVVDPFMQPIDGLGPIKGEKTILPIERDAPGIKERVRITQQLVSGVSLVDFLVPLGKGQRQLIMGDQKTGRTTFLLQAAIAQTLKGAICVYVGIGKKKSDMKFVEEYLRKTKAMESSVIIFTSSADPSPLVHLAPFAGFTAAEYFRDQGREVLIMLDDLTTHAKFYREISLLSSRMPARESYPGDIFHVHARLLERAGNFKKGPGSVSITALPVVETVQGDLTGFLPTNAMAMTDGHLFFDVSEFKKGRRPAINVSQSVTRVGNQTQRPLEQEIRKTLAEKLSRYRKALEIAHFGFDLPLQTRTELNFGERLETVFDQESSTIIDKSLAMLLFGLLLNDFWSAKQIEQVRVERAKIVEANAKGLLTKITAKVSQALDLEGLKNAVKEEVGEVENILYSVLPEKEEGAIGNPNVKIQMTKEA